MRVRATIRAFLVLFYGLTFYPVMIGLFLWLYIKEAHWIYGLAVIAAILLFDPIWGHIGRSIRRRIKNDTLSQKKRR